MIKIEPVNFMGETRYRFWLSPSAIACGFAQSDGGHYKTIREAREAGEREAAFYGISPEAA